jgi:TRAP-type mannitol/chloroaromatic compound transport system permease small subunit
MAKNKWIAFAKKIDGISDWTGRLFAWLVVPLTVLIVFEVITRRFFGAPTIWTFELSNFLYGGHFMLVAAYGLLYKAHVRIDIFVMRGSKRTQEIFDLISYFILFFPFIIVILYHGIDFAKDSWATLETSWSAWGPPLSPIKTVIPITAFLLLIQGISEVIKKFVYLKTGEEL